jgi:hypothetical protein
VIGSIGLLFVIKYDIKDTNYFLEADVIAPEHVAKDSDKLGTISDEQVEAENEKERQAREIAECKH